MISSYLISLPIDLRALRRWAAARGFGADEGCALHHLLSETFGKSAHLQPFRLLVRLLARPRAPSMPMRAPTKLA